MAQSKGVKAVVQWEVGEQDVREGANPEVERAIVNGEVWMDTDWPDVAMAQRLCPGMSYRVVLVAGDGGLWAILRWVAQAWWASLDTV